MDNESVERGNRLCIQMKQTVLSHLPFPWLILTAVTAAAHGSGQDAGGQRPDCARHLAFCPPCATPVWVPTRRQVQPM